MKKINISWIIGVIWILVACLLFSIDKVWVGKMWLAVGIINILRAIRIAQKDKQIDDNQHKMVMKTIELSNEVHTIYDEYIGYGYVVNKAFKPAKSHAAEGELLCTYAPNDEYGWEGDFPYIAVQIDDAVYCAVEEYKESKTFDGAISIEPLEGKFLFRAKRDYYGDMMYFYGFELEGDEYWDMAGLCLVYPQGYVGTEEEAKLMRVLDEAAQSFKKN